MNWQMFLVTLGISDLNAGLGLLVQLSTTGPNFKAAAQNALAALTALSEAAQNPKV